MFWVIDTITDEELIKIDEGFKAHINPFVNTGYRIPTNDILECCKTVYKLHNETINIFSHFLGFWIFLIILIKWTYENIMEKSWTETIAIYIYLTTITSLMFFSSTYHLSTGHSVECANKCQCLDWMGVSFYIGGAAIYTAYNELYKNGYKSAYMIFFIIIVSSVLFFAIYLDMSVKECHIDKDTGEEVCEYEFNYEEGHFQVIIRTFIVSLFSLTTLIAWLIHYFLRGEMTEKMKKTLIGILLTYVGMGTVAFKLLCYPEKYFPKTFDIFGYSHQIFHTGVLIGALILWYTYQ